MHTCIVTVLLPLSADFNLDESTVPEQEVAPLSTRQHLTIRQLNIGRDVRDLNATKLAQLPLQLQTCECGCHLPEPVDSAIVQSST